jgi:hypothetical protein
MPDRNRPFLRKARRNEVLAIETNQTTAIRQYPTVDRDNPRTEKFEGSLISQIITPIASYFYIRTRDGNFHSLKTNQAIPSFIDMTDETRTRTLQVIYNWGPAPSSMVARLLGLTARQIGQIRRWHIPNWRLIGNAQIYRANNYRRPIV